VDCVLADFPPLEIKIWYFANWQDIVLWTAKEIGDLVHKANSGHPDVLWVVPDLWLLKANEIMNSASGLMERPNEDVFIERHSIAGILA
jgi:hypothetical protein